MSLLTLFVNILVGVLAVGSALLCLAGLVGYFVSLVRTTKVLNENRRDDGAVQLSPKERRRLLNRNYANAWAFMMIYIWGNLAFVMASWLFDFGIHGVGQGYATIFAVALATAFLILGGNHNKLVAVLRDPESGYLISADRVRWYARRRNNNRRDG